MLEQRQKRCSLCSMFMSRLAGIWVCRLCDVIGHREFDK